MVNKYKLKKWYPSLPKSWERMLEEDEVIVELIEQSFLLLRKHQGCGIRLEYNEVVLNPEFWEKVEEQDWEILEVKQHDGRLSNVVDFSDGYITALLNTLGVTIHSVRRKKDNKVFTVGDKLEFEERYITAISLNPNSTIPGPEKKVPWFECGEEHGISMCIAKHYKEPILITEDGKEIYEGDVYWRVTAVVKNQRIFVHTEKVDERGEFPHREGGGKYFSTAELAREYITETKPLLITEDGKELFQGDYFWHVYDWEVCRGKLMDGNLLKGYRHFSTKELALEYVRMNKPMYNRKDILELFEELKVHTFAYWGYLLDVMLSKKRG